MNAIEASSGTYRSRVDGTIVLSVEIEPRFRADALALFGMPGTPIALVALKVQSSKQEEEEPESETGYWCLRAVKLCRDPSFWKWITFASMSGASPTCEEDAAEVIRKACKITSRKELDTDMKARMRFVNLILTPYSAWQKKAA